MEACENYVKRSYRNRCHIASVNGVQRLTVPLLKGKNEGQSIREVRISYDQNWQSNHWHAIRSAYGNSPFFEHYVDEIAPYFKESKPEFLWDMNEQIIKGMMDLMGIKRDLVFTEKYEKEPTRDVLDLRNKISPKANEVPIPFKASPYAQVFSDRHDFLPDLSILDLIFCTGPAALSILKNSISSD